jgi:homoprotocatechuate degradation regulator HpaR
MPPDPALRSFSRSLPMALLRCRDAVMARFRPMLREHGISEQQWRILRALDSDGPMRASDLAADTLLSLPSLSRLVKTLAERRLVHRGVSAQDQRAVAIGITDKGRRLVAQVAPLSEAIYAELAAEIGTGQLDRLYRMLAHATASLAPAPPRTGTGPD